MDRDAIKRLEAIGNTINQRMELMKKDEIALGTTLNESYLEAGNQERSMMEAQVGIAVMRSQNVSTIAKNLLEVAEDSVQRVQDTGVGVESIAGLREQMSMLIELTELNNDISLDEKKLLMDKFSEINETVNSKKFSRVGMVASGAARGLKNVAKSFIDPVNIVAKLTGGNMLATGLTRYILDRRAEGKKADLAQKKLRAQFRIESTKKLLEATETLDLQGTNARALPQDYGIRVAGEEFSGNNSYEDIKNGVRDGIEESASDSVKRIALDSIQEQLDDRGAGVIVPAGMMSNVAEGVLNTPMNDPEFITGFREGLMEELRAAGFEDMNQTIGELLRLAEQKIEPEIAQTNDLLSKFIRDQEFAEDRSKEEKREFAEMIKDITQPKTLTTPSQKSGGLGSIVGLLRGGAGGLGSALRGFATVVGGFLGFKIFKPMISLLKGLPSMIGKLGGILSPIGKAISGMGSILGSVMKTFLGTFKKLGPILRIFANPAALAASLSGIIGYKLGTFIYEKFGVHILDAIDSVMEALRWLKNSKFGKFLGMSDEDEAGLPQQRSDSRRASIESGLKQTEQNATQTKQTGRGGADKSEKITPSQSAAPETVPQAPRGRGASQARSRTPKVVPVSTVQPKTSSESKTPQIGPVSSLSPDFTVADAISQASERVGVDKGFMIAMAKQESSFDPNAKAGTSSASGLFQFIDKTWNSMLSKYGSSFPELSLGRFNPVASATAGALYAKENSDALKKAGIPVNGTTLYASHFLGSSGARKLLSAPGDAIAADILPSAAASNQYVFYNKDGTAKTVSQVQEFLYNKVGKETENYNKLLETMTPSQVVAGIIGKTVPSAAPMPTTAPLKEGGIVSTPKAPVISESSISVFKDEAPMSLKTAPARGRTQASIDEERKWSSPIATVNQSMGETSTQRFGEDGQVLREIDIARDGPAGISDVVGGIEKGADAINRTVDGIIQKPLEAVLGKGRNYAQRMASTASKRFGVESSQKNGSPVVIDAKKTTVNQNSKASGSGGSASSSTPMEPTLQRLSNMNLFHVFVN